MMATKLYAMLRIVFFILAPLAVAVLWSLRDVHPFDVEKVLSQAILITSRSWEYGTLAEALLELHDPQLAVFSQEPLAGGRLPCPINASDVAALRYAKPLIWINDTDQLIEGEGSPADPASLGATALLLSCEDARYLTAARRQADYLRDHATRFRINTTNTAISHRDEPPELWGDFVYMVPPFLAYYGVVTGDLAFIREAVQQCQLYRDVLETNVTLPDGSTCLGLWRHIVSQPPQLKTGVCCNDPDVWLTSNAWAIAGMTRVLATIAKWLPPKDSALDRDSHIEFVTDAKATLLTMITRMLDCLVSQSRDSSCGLLKNYLDGEGQASVVWAYGDAAGTALVTSAVYRLAVLVPEQFSGSTYLSWAGQNLAAVAKHVDRSGKVSPVASVDVVPSKRAAEQTSEGQSMAILLYAAWRDCVRSGVCEQSWWKMLRSWLSKIA